MAGVLVLNGGDEFHRGNEPQDEALRVAALAGPAYVIATAARDAPEAAVRTAQRWFAGLGLAITELRLRTPADARSGEIAAQAADGGFFYIVGGDPGRVVQVLRDSLTWKAIASAWSGGAALAGSSAGAMALCRWTLVRAAFPGHTRRRAMDALDLVPDCAVLPHFDAFGERWIPSARAALGSEALLLGLDERTAAAWSDGGWTAMGRGRVTLLRSDERRVFGPGEHIEGMPAPHLA